MAFRLRHRRAVGDELAKLAKKELRKALDSLSSGEPDDDAIHAARVSLKKVRALLRLVESDTRTRVVREQKRLRNAARELSTLRDDDAARATLRILRDRYPTVITREICAAIDRGLRARSRPLKARSTRTLNSVTGQIRRARKTTPARIRRVRQIDTVRAGMVDEYAAARRRLKSLSSASASADIHAWRRRVKAHWYHMRLFQAMNVTPRARMRSIEQLDGWLGLDHDLMILKDAILTEPARYGDARGTALVLGCIDKYQVALRTQALARGRRLFAAKPAELSKSIEKWWSG